MGAEDAWRILTDPLVTAADFMDVRTPETTSGLLKIRRRRTALLLDIVLARRRETRCDTRKSDFLDAMLLAQERHGYGIDLIVETVVSLTSAGINTVSTALEWLLLLLALHPDA